MTNLSFTTCNELINAPHTWLNKVAQLPRFSNASFDQGKRVHEIVQKSVSGVEPLPVLAHLPTFAQVETMDRDPKMEVHKQISNKYSFHGYVDCRDDERREFGDIKSGTPWGVKQMATHPQFWLYSWALDYTKFILINLPKDPNTWTKNNVTMMRMEFNPGHHAKAQAWLEKAIYTIEHIRDFVLDEDLKKSKHYCYYKNCLLNCHEKE